MSSCVTSSIRLSPVEMVHADAMYQWMLDPVVSGNLGLRSEPSLQKTREWIARAADQSAFLAFAIYSDERHVGNVVFDQMGGGSARLSIYIGEADERNKGLGTKAMRLALTKVFTERDFHTIWLTVHDDNTRARHVYEKLGFRMTASGQMVLPRDIWVGQV